MESAAAHIMHGSHVTYRCTLHELTLSQRSRPGRERAQTGCCCEPAATNELCNATATAVRGSQQQHTMRSCAAVPWTGHTPAEVVRPVPCTVAVSQRECWRCAHAARDCPACPHSQIHQTPASLPPPHVVTAPAWGLMWGFMPQRTIVGGWHRTRRCATQVCVRWGSSGGQTGIRLHNRVPGCPFDSAWCLVCEVCRVTVDCVDCGCFLSFVFLGGARLLELSPCNTTVCRVLARKPVPASTRCRPLGGVLPLTGVQMQRCVLSGAFHMPDTTCS